MLACERPRARSLVALAGLLGVVVLVGLAPAGSREAGRSLVREIVCRSGPGLTRVVITLERPVRYTVRRLEADAQAQLPSRLYVDLQPARLPGRLARPQPVNNGLVRNLRAGQFSHEVVRVVLDLEQPGSYVIRALQGPARLVLELRAQKEPRSAADGPGQGADPAAPPVASRPEGGRQRSDRASAARGEKNGTRAHRIVLDPGHGGKDPGAVGPGGLQEKDVVLDLARRLERRLREERDTEVILTRRDDTFLDLHERTALANERNADLFVSLHTNSSPNRALHGIETYYLGFTSDQRALEVAARENASVPNKLVLHTWLNDLLLNTEKAQDSVLAQMVHRALITGLARSFRPVRDLGVKQAPFYVLRGARMPSILAEVAFINHPREARWLRDPQYLARLCEALHDGIRTFLAGARPQPAP